MRVSSSICESRPVCDRGNLFGYLVVPALGYLSRTSPALALPLVTLVTTLLGAAFPLTGTPRWFPTRAPDAG